MVWIIKKQLALKIASCSPRCLPPKSYQIRREHRKKAPSKTHTHTLYIYIHIYIYIYIYTYIYIYSIPILYPHFMLHQCPPPMPSEIIGSWSPVAWRSPGHLGIQGDCPWGPVPGDLGDLWIQSFILEGSLEVKLPTIWTEEKQSREEAERRERVRRKKMQMRGKVGKSRNTVFFQWFGAPEGRKVGSLKRRVRSQLARWEMKSCTPLWREAHLEVKMYKTHQGVEPLLEVAMSKKCTPLWREAHFEVKMYKTHHSRTTFGSWDVEKVHAVVARSTFWSQNVQNTPFSDHFWKLRCWKSARRCGAKHILKSKCTKHTILGPLLEVEMSKKCTPLWREAHFQVKMYKTPHVRATFGGSDVEKVHAVVARSTFRSQNVKNTRVSDHFWRFRCRFASLHYMTLHYTPLHCIALHYTTLHYTTLQLQLHNYTPLHSTTLHYTKSHYTTLHYTTLHYTTLHYTTLHYLPLHFTTLHYTTLHYNYTTTLHYNTLHYAKLHYTTLHYTTLPSTTLHYITLHYTTLQLHNYTPLQYTPLR